LKLDEVITGRTIDRLAKHLFRGFQRLIAVWTVELEFTHFYLPSILFSVASILALIGQLPLENIPSSFQPVHFMHATCHLHASLSSPTSFRPSKLPGGKSAESSLL